MAAKSEVWELILNRKHKAAQNTCSIEGFLSSKPSTSDTLPPAMLYFKPVTKLRLSVQTSENFFLVFIQTTTL